MNSLRVQVTVAFWCIAIGSAWAIDDETPLGTLLFSADERRSVSAARTERLGQGTDTGWRIDGLVARSSGKNTVWINGEALREGQATVSGDLPSVGKKSVGLAGRTVRVGEAIDSQSNARVDLIPQSALRVRRQP